MRIERVTPNQVKIFVSYKDLEERAIDPEEFWRNGSGSKAQELFWEMIDLAYEEVGFSIEGHTLVIEAFVLPSGFVVVITKREEESEEEEEATEEPFDPDMVCSFSDFEDAVDAAHTLYDIGVEGASLYRYRDLFHLVIHCEEEEEDQLYSILSEYGEINNVTLAVLQEYGKPIIENEAIERLVTAFPL